MKIWIFEMPIITQTLNINNLRSTSAKSINLHTIRKLADYSFKNVAAKAMFTLTVFEILLSEVRPVLSPAQRGTGSERVNVMNNLQLCTLQCYEQFSIVYPMQAINLRSQTLCILCLHNYPEN